MIPLAVKLLIGGLGFAGLLALGTSTASAKPSGASGGIPSDLAQRMVTALALGDPAKLRVVASELRARGFNADADKLDAEAAKIEAGGKPSVTPPSSSTGKPPASSPPTTASPPPQQPGALPGTTAGPVTDAKQLAAAAVARAPKDATKVRAFQTQEGLVSDGKYGPKSATALIKYGFVPPTPIAWPNDNNASRALYIALLKAQADKDPVRREEWLQAAQAASLPLAGAGVPASAPVSRSNIPILRQGSKGPNVVYLQKLLNQNGAALKQNGVFDSALRGTVIGFQKTHRNPAGILLKPDGIVGEQTWTALGAFR